MGTGHMGAALAGLQTNLREEVLSVTVPNVDCQFFPSASDLLLLLSMMSTCLCFILISCLTFLSLSQGLEAQTDLPSARISCPEGTNAYGSYCYFFNPDKEAWIDADLLCQNMHSGHLVSVLSEAEGTFVAALIKDTGFSVTNVWVGLHDPKKNRRWRWSSGALVSYKAWGNDAPSSNNPGYCVSLTSNSGFEKWKDMNCDNKLSFVCKFKS
ncbi:PREDICTED: lithostathine-1-alpha-like [Chrysochloris asiatica]|uniref:Lithostathine-1-alpha-like n=1 Tax=Chrysochloris asiatica TaxID=185453 RepID=A0A9B0U0N3_CHRAS|nr:PREDICTED: lithostathine-1-alpha-like [Chrysochloris asiatica]